MKKQLIKLFIWVLKQEFGPKCDTKDTEDYPELQGHEARCSICRAYEFVEWLEYLYDIKK